MWRNNGLVQFENNLEFSLSKASNSVNGSLQMLLCSPVLWSLPTEIFCSVYHWSVVWWCVLSSGPDVVWQAEAVHSGIFMIPSLAYDRCVHFPEQLRQHQNWSIPWPVERWEQMRHCRDVVGGRQGLDPDSSSLAGIGCSCKGGLCPSGSWSSCSSKLCWGWKRIGRSVMRFLLFFFFSQTSRLSLLVFELILPLWVKTKVAVMQTIMQPSCLPLTAI